MPLKVNIIGTMYLMSKVNSVANFPGLMIQKGLTQMTGYHFSYIVSTLVSSTNAKEYATIKPINSNQRKLGSCNTGYGLYTLQLFKSIMQISDGRKAQRRR
jgi:hypothetical protein